MKTFLLALFLFVTNSVHGQSVQWACKGGGTATDIGKSIAVDNAGNSYVTGTFQNVTTFGSYSLTGQTTATNTFIAKYNSNGTVIWLRQISGVSNNSPSAIIYCNSLNCIYIAGKFSGSSISFGFTTLTCSGSNDCFFAKYDLSGNCLWAIKAGSVNGDEADDIDCDPSGNLIATGWAFSGAIFGAFTMPVHPLMQTFVTSISPTGIFLFLTVVCHTNGGSLVTPYPTVKCDLASNIYVTGLYSGSCNFGTQTIIGQGLVSNSNVFLQKLTPFGLMLWTISIGGTSPSASTGITSDATGDVYITGNFKATVNFGGVTRTSVGASFDDIFVAKYGPQGNLVWVNQYGGNNNDYGKSIRMGPLSKLLVSGYYSSTMLMGSYWLTPVGNSDAFCCVLDIYGNAIWAESYGGSLMDIFSSAIPDNSWNIYADGYFSGSSSVYGAYTLNSSGGSDVNVVKILPNIPLPVELVSFNAKPDVKNHNVVCNWTTASELNNDYFILEKSTDGKSFKSVTIVSGSGNSSAISQYQFTDCHPYSGLSYYRLLQTDFNGNCQILKTVAVQMNLQNSFSVECHSTISNGLFNVNASKPISEIEVFDCSGKLVRNENISSSSFILHFENLETGFYFIKFYSGDESLFEKVMIN